ncbi:MAG TPA: DUF5916 domain-containing protein [Holophagaceae bacterium]|nr:DUF5916 domain-containing protein [Holophagaceae bacterium]HJW32244.1 DUF5916 domain-containing protein [Holophagaceae bacterium]
MGGNRHWTWILQALLGGLGVGLVAQDAPPAPPRPQGLRARRTTEPITLDGSLSEGAWAQAEVGDSFRQSWPRWGAPAPQRTDVRVLYDDHYLYVGARMRHTRGLSKIVKRLHRRDQDSVSDWFGVYIDSLHDHRSALAFYVNAAGVQRDGAWFSDTGFDGSWDGVWESSVARDADGWTVEIRIPLSLLRIRPEDGASWGINFSRSDQGPLRATSWWSLAPRDENAFVSRFPELTGLEGLQPARRQEWLPYLTGRSKFATAQSWDDRGAEVRAGVDGHLALSGTTQLDLALKPDFGQVEVDQAVLNLSTTETWLPERRPFFVEGADLFGFNGPQLFYSRRIGRGLGAPALATGETLVAMDRSLALQGAAKITDRDFGGAQVGLLAASAESATYRVREADGTETSRTLAPSQDFLVARGVLPLDARGSTVGVLGTWTRQSQGGRLATVEGVDGAWRSADRSNSAEGALVHSEAGSAVDAEQGWYARGHFQHRFNGLSTDLTLVNAGHDFNPNDLGYLARADEQRISARAQRRFEPLGPFREATFGTSVGMSRDQAGHTFSRWISADFGGGLPTFFGVWGGATVSLPAGDDQELRTFRDPQKKYLQRGSIPSAWMGFDTPGNRPWYVAASWSGAWHPGGPSTGLSLNQTLRPTEDIEVSLGTNLSHQEGELRYLAADPVVPDTPLVGLRRLSSFNQSLQVAYSPRADLSLQLQTQWLAANWNYREVQAWSEGTLTPKDYEGESAFSTRSWNLNLITRWEYRPGSTVFLVYSRGVATDALINARASLSPSRDIFALRGLPSDEVIQMKVSYLLR